MATEPDAPGGQYAVEPDEIERAAIARDAALVRRVRWQLAGWSGGITLLILLVLGAAFYGVVSGRLEAASIARLEARIAQIVPEGPAELDDMPPLELVMGGASSGTFAYLVASDGYVFRPPFGGPESLPDMGSLAASRSDGRDVRNVEADHVPFRVLSQPLSGSVVSPAFGRVPIDMIQVVEDRVAEQGTLDLMLELLLAGGAAVVLVAIIAGAVYSDRALVPIRESLAAQRRALRRQRDFAADASHELRTPLAIIRASVEDMRLHAQQPVESVGAALVDIEAEVAHLTSLVDDLLLLARSESGALDLTLEAVELGDIAAAAAGAMSGRARDRDVTIVVEPEPVMVRGDRVRLRQLVTILTDNGVRHSPRGATVRVRVQPAGDEAVLLVEDQGPGIDPADLPHVFDRFWRGRGPMGDGAGLGLAIADSIARGHGGRISVSSPPRAGACFTVRLPLLPPDAVHPDVATPDR